MSDNDELDAELLALADEESGEASGPGSPDSLGSGAMSESEDEGMADDDGGHLYPLEGKYKDDHDKTRILGLSEIEREQILADRAAEVEKQSQDKHLQQLFQRQGQKRSAANADLDDGQRKSSRQKVKTNEPLEDYKRQREQRRGQEMKRERERKERRGRASRSPSSPKPGSDRDADGESEVEWDSGRKAPVKEDPPADMKDLQHALIKRENFAKVCFWPGFDNAMTGCFCRVSVGPGENGSNTYRIGQIKGFEERQPYTVENDKGKLIMTDQYVICKHGRDVKTVPFSHISNSKITDAEFDRFKSVLASEDMKFPLRSYVNVKLEDISALLNRVFTEDELNQKLKRQDKYATKLAEVTNASAPKTKSATQIQAERLEALNRENRKRNNEEIRSALLAERKAERQARAAAAAKHHRRVEEERVKVEKEAAKSAKLSVPAIDDLFDGSDISRTGTPDATKISRAGTPLQKKELKGIPTFKKKAMDDDVIAAMDFGVEIDI